MKVYLERVDHATSMRRFYVVKVMLTLFGDWAAMREWVRIGQGGTVRDIAFPSESKSWQAAAEIMRGKVRRGYVQLDGRLRSVGNWSLGPQELTVLIACPMGG